MFHWEGIRHARERKMSRASLRVTGRGNTSTKFASTQFSTPPPSLESAAARFHVSTIASNRIRNANSDATTNSAHSPLLIIEFLLVGYVCNECVEKSVQKFSRVLFRNFEGNLSVYTINRVSWFLKKKISRAFSVHRELYTAIFLFFFFFCFDAIYRSINFHSSEFHPRIFFFFFYNEVIKINKTGIFYSFKVLLQFYRITILYSLSKVIFWK